MFAIGRAVRKKMEKIYLEQMFIARNCNLHEILIVLEIPEISNISINFAVSGEKRLDRFLTTQTTDHTTHDRQKN